MEARVAALEAAIMGISTVAQTDAHVKDQLEKYIGIFKDLIKFQKPDHAPGQLRLKDAKDNSPKEWSGDKDKITVTEFMASVKNWVDVLHDEGVEMLEQVEGSRVPIDEDKVDEEKF